MNDDEPLADEDDEITWLDKRTESSLAGEPADAAEPEDAVERSRVQRLCVNWIAWLVTLVGALVPGVFPIALNFTVATGREPTLTMERIYGWIAGPVFGACWGALLGLPFGARWERLVRLTLVSVGAGVIVAFVAGQAIDRFGQHQQLDEGSVALARARLAIGLLPLSLAGALVVGVSGRRFRLGLLLAGFAAIGLLLSWASAPLRPTTFMVAAEPVLRAVQSRAVEDQALRPLFPPELRKVTTPQPYMSLNLSPRLFDGSTGRGPGEVGTVTLAIGLGRYSAVRIAGTGEDSRDVDGSYRRCDVWRVDGGEVGLYLRSRSGDPRAHDRLLIIVREELRRRGIRVEPI